MAEPWPRGASFRRALRSIRFRVAALFVAALVAMSSAQVFLSWQQREVAASLRLITEGYLPLAKIVARLDQDRQRIETDRRRLLSDSPRPEVGDISLATIYTEELKRSLAEGRIHADFVQRLARSPSEQAVLTKVGIQLGMIDTLFRDYQAASQRLVELAEAGRAEDARKILSPLKADGDRLSEEIVKLSAELDNRIVALTRDTEAAQTQGAAASAALTVLAIVLSLAALMAVMYALRPIGELTTQVKRLAAGDYSGRVEVRGSDEIALLAAEFDAMARAIERRDRTLVERAEELKRLSGYLANVLDSLEEGLLVVEDGSVTLANPAAIRVWDAQVGQPPPPQLAPLLRSGSRLEVEGPNRTEQDVRVAELGSGGFVVVSADVTEQNRARRRLARSERLALVGQMLAQITHEVRNPLNALSLNAEMLAEELDELAPREHEAWALLAVVSREIDRLTRVTAHYLQLARRPPARLEQLDLTRLVHEAARFLSAELEAAGVELDLEVAPGIRQPVDPNQLRQALLNIVQNAVSAGARRVQLGLQRSGRHIELRCADDGPGMEEAEMARACEPFYTTRVDGTGLGLAITKQILEDHDGSVELARAPGGGTVVRLLLPTHPEPSTPSSSS